MGYNLLVKSNELLTNGVINQTKSVVDEDTDRLKYSFHLSNQILLSSISKKFGSLLGNERLLTLMKEHRCDRSMHDSLTEVLGNESSPAGILVIEFRLFKFLEHSIADSALEELNNLANLLTNNPSVMVDFINYVVATEDAERDQILSERRA